MIELASLGTVQEIDPSFHGGPNHFTEHSFLEFFAGIGLTHSGLAPYGWRCVYANDIEPKKRKMYEDYFGKSNYYHIEDIWNTDRILSKIPPARADLASASFPCVDLSLAGNLKGFDGQQSGAFYGFLKVLAALKDKNALPSTVLIENVIGFLSAREGKFFRIALKELSKLGYYVDAFVVDAKYFVPQSRPRLFLIGYSAELLAERQKKRPYRLHPFWTTSDSKLRPAKLVHQLNQTTLPTGWVPLDLPELPSETRTLEKVIETKASEDWWAQALVEKHLAEMHKRHRDRVEQLSRQKALTVGTIYRRVRDGKSRSEIRTDGLAGCLRTPRGGSSRQIVLVAGKGRVRMRWMSPREYARLQGCPDFPIDVDCNQALYGFGDAVCVPVIRWIAENVLTQLFPLTGGPGEILQAAGD